ncbi:MAG: c-type cytochrome [Caldilineaceae bacterium]|nr:c-type cytochrome [Caldilineaceae bacterium]
MNSLAPHHRLAVIASCLFISVMLIVVGCAPDATGEIISPDLGPRLVIARSEGDIQIEPTPVPPKLAELTPDQIYAGLPDDVRQAIEGADASAGQSIALKYGCVGCHATDPNTVSTGPTWHNIGDAAVIRVSGESPALYLYDSIVQPNAFVVPGYPGNIMPQNFGDTMSTQELAEMVAYLLQHNGQ